MTDIDATGPLPRVPTRFRSRMVARSGIRPWIRRFDFHPGWWVALAAVAAWWFVWMMHAQPALAPHANGHGHHGAADVHAGMGFVGLWGMTIAMMLPLTIGWVRDVARAAEARHRATAAFLAGYLALWMPAIVLIDAAWRVASSSAGEGRAVVGVIVVAALWEVAAAVHPRLRRCDRPMPSVARGWRAYLASFRFGTMTGADCLLSCWALMAACVAFAHDFRVMVGLFIVQLSGRYRPIRINLRGPGARHPPPTGTAGARVR
jgi:hypothetical protein